MSGQGKAPPGLETVAEVADRLMAAVNREAEASPDIEALVVVSDRVGYCTCTRARISPQRALGILKQLVANLEAGEIKRAPDKPRIVLSS